MNLTCKKGNLRHFKVKAAVWKAFPLWHIKHCPVGGNNIKLPHDLKLILGTYEILQFKP